MLYNIFDSHAHYDDEKFDEDREELFKTMRENGVVGIIHAATDIQSSLRGIEFTKKHDCFYTSVGVHPECVENLEDNYISELEKLIDENRVVAIGEIGLDYYWTKDTRDKQLEVFENQLILAKKKNLPVIIHSREATKDCMDLLNKYKPKGVVHCFSGSSETAKEILRLGMYIGFTGVLTFPKSEKAKSSLMVIPVDRLLLETDAPYMAPVPMRGKRCDSSMIAYTAQKAAEIKGMDTQELLNITKENVERLFSI